MNKPLVLFALFVFLGAQLLAQTKLINGLVTSQVDGNPIPGVSVVAIGTAIGTITDMDGNYSLNVPENTRILMFTFVGMKTVQETIGDRTTINVGLEPDVLGLDEMIVTAFGTTRKKMTIGYSIQDVRGEDLVTAREPNIVNSLQGRFSGVQITNSDGTLAAGVRILIRGMSKFNGDNQPLWVVDGVPISNAYSEPGKYGGMDWGNNAMDLNPSDIESISILKGANAAALYGSRALNGVVLVTTKNGKPSGGKQGLGVTFETNWMWTNPLVLPDFQDEYGQGLGGQFSYVDGAYGGGTDGVDESWGPPLDKGLSIPQWDSPYDPETGIRTATPWVSQPDNVKDFFVTGRNRTTNLALQGGDDRTDFRLSLSNQDQTGIMENTDLKKNTVNLNLGLAVTNKIRIGGAATYISNRSDNLVERGYSGSNPMQSLSMFFGRQVNMDNLRNMWEEIDPISDYNMNWNHSYHDNPYFILYKNTNSRDRDRIFGNINLQYELTDWLIFKTLVGTDWYVEDRKMRTAHRTNGDRQGGFTADSRKSNELNTNAMFTMNRDIGANINIIASLGGEFNRFDYEYQSTIVKDLIVPDLYSVSNAVDAAIAGSSETHTELQSLFGSVNLGFRNFLFLDLTGRNDWSSTLPIENNSYFYPSVSLGFVLTEALEMQSNILSFAKLRASYAKVGDVASPYQLEGIYTVSDPFNGNPVMTYTNTGPPLNLKPPGKKSVEFGAEMKFMNNLIGLDVTWYKENTTNQVMVIPVPGAMGFNYQTINVGNLQNMGLEFTLWATPLKTSALKWDLAINWSANKNKVIELHEDLNYLDLFGAAWSVQVRARPGKEFGELWGYTLVRENAERVDYDDGTFAYYDYSGKPLVSTTGAMVRSGDRVPLGNVYPDWFGGVHNAISWKNLNLSFLVDFRKGGDIFSVSDLFGHYSGMLSTTSYKNNKGVNIRQDVAIGGGVKMDAYYGRQLTDGTIQFENATGAVSNVPVKNETYINAESFYHGYFGKNKLSVFDASFIKLREVVLGYTFRDIPFLTRVGINNIHLSLVGRNLWIIHSNVPNIDPEYGMGAGNYVGMESAAIPSVRSYGFDLKVSF
ncbi:MAG: SusC/RagA family TonB-linked outer membrane protein [Bacteroidales bacterium]|nr:SusC/RagA family TonB-linked outer membrane protein [Bacteroidales bacterium]